MYQLDPAILLPFLQISINKDHPNAEKEKSLEEVANAEEILANYSHCIN